MRTSSDESEKVLFLVGKLANFGGPPSELRHTFLRHVTVSIVSLLWPTND